MGQDPSTGGTAVAQKPDPQELRREIEQTRLELGDTVAGLAGKADIKAQAKQLLDAKKASVSQKKDQLIGKARAASPERPASAASSVAATVRANPMPIAAVAVFAVGFLIGRSRNKD